MTSPPDDNTTDLHAVIAALRSERDAALSEKAALAEELAKRDAALAQRNAEFGERIDHQTATIDVLKAMSASPGDAQPVFDLITHRARQLCDGVVVGLTEFDGELVHMRSASAVIDPGAHEAFMALFPMRPVRGSIVCRAILERQLIHIRDAYAEPDLLQHVRNNRTRAILAIPLMRDDTVIGSIALNSMEPGGFSESQVELLKTFAEQAVIAITSAETYRALQTRTSDLQETLEYQTAISDVLNVISRSAFDLQPVLETLVQTSARLCSADRAAIFRREGDLWRLAVNFGFPPAWEDYMKAQGAFSSDRFSEHAAVRAVMERRPVHIDDMAAVPGYGVVRLGEQRTTLGVPLLREGEAIGTIVLARLRVEPFTDRQIELVSTFADQAVIAIENTRLITEQREALEQQTAMAEVLQVINASPGNLTPVFDTVLQRVTRLCDAAFGIANTYDGERFRTAALHRVPAPLAELWLSAAAPPPGPNSPLSRIASGEDIIHIEDFAATPTYRTGEPRHRAMVELGGARSYVAVALRRQDGALLGTLAAYRQEVRPFSDKEIALLTSFAAQAVIAIENARLITETREALEQQTATAEVLQVINASPGNLAPVFDAMLERAMRLCGAAFGELHTFDGTHFRAAALQGIPAALAEFRRNNPLGNAPGSTSGRMIAGESLIQIADLAEEDAYRDGGASRRALVDLGGARSLLAVALRKEDILVGLIAIYRQEVRPFDERQVALLRNFGVQAVIAMESARLLTEQQEALEQQTATAEVLQVINASPGNLAPVFEAILEKALDLCDIAYGDLQLYDGEHLHSVAQRGLSAGFADRLRQGYRASDSPASRPLLAGDRFTHITDAAAVDFMVFRSAVQLDGIRTVLFVPLRKDGSLLGMITSARREVRPFTEKEIALLENFAAQAVIAMENARLINEQREALEQQTATAEVLQVINASPGNLAPVFDAILEKAHKLCSADHGSFYITDGEAFRAVAVRGMPDAFADLIRQPFRPSPNHPVQQLIAGTPFAVVHDASKIDDPIIQGSLRLAGMHSALFVPLQKDKLLLGFIVASSPERRAFTDKQVALLQNFAAQAVIAMENARLITEQREALEQQTATSEVLQVINASPGNLAPVFDAILEKAHSLCGATVGSLVTYDGEFFRAVATHGFPEQHATTVRLPVRASARHHALLRGERFVQTPDLRAIELSAEDIIMRGLIELTDARTRLMVPLRKDGALLGFITAYRPEVRLFSDKEIALLENFAAQAVIAMENARLINEQREALEQQTATAEVLQVINASPGDLAPVFDAMLEKAMRLCGAAYGVLRSFDGNVVRILGSHGVPPAYAAFLARNAGTPAQGSGVIRALQTGRPAQTLDAKESVGYKSGAPGGRAIADLGGARTVLHVPLVKDQVSVGLFTFYRQEVRGFSDKQIALLENFAAQAVIAMENARLLDEIRQRQEELRVTFDNMGDGVAMFDTDLRLAAWNRNFQRIIDLPDTLLETRLRYADYLRLLAERGEFGTTDIEAELSLRIEDTDKELRLERARPDGRVIEVRRNAVPGGGVVLIYSDITERKRSEEEIRAARDDAEAALRELRTAQANLIQAEKMASLGQLTAGIAHEIKNPLNFVNNFAALSVDLLGELKETAAPSFAVLTDDQRAEVEDISAMLTSNLEKITEHGRRADGIVKAMLEHSRGSSGERRVADLNALIDEALNLAYHGARAQDQSFNITLERDFGEGIAPIEVNPQDITRVFLNIFSNGFYAATRRACDGGDAGFMPTLKISTRDAGEAVEIRVRDNGTGIPADIRDKLFQPFFTTKPTGEGTGLGLSITYDIVTQQHGGAIAVESKVGEYSEFTIRLPRIP